MRNRVDTLLSRAWASEASIRLGTLFVPQEIFIHGDLLCWTFRSPREVPVPDDLLERFLKLSNASDERILAFSRSFGLLGLCKHDLPYTHALVQAGSDPKGCGWVDVPELKPEWGVDVYCERVATWKGIAMRMRTRLELLRALRDQIDYGVKADVKELWARVGDAFERWKDSPERQIQEVIRTANHFLYLSIVVPSIEAHEGRPALALQPVMVPDLFGQLAIQYALEVAEFASLPICSACDAPYAPPPGRRPRRDRRRFCEACRKAGIPNRIAQRERYRRKLEAQRLRREVLPPKRIAALVGSRVDTVERWLKS